MAQEGSLELPERVVAKIQKVLGISPASLPEHDLVSLIEELCDTALMFDQNAQGAGQTKDDEGLAVQRKVTRTRVWDAHLCVGPTFQSV